MHKSNTRHIELKYRLMAKALNDAIIKRYPYIKVYIKPINISIKDTQKQFSFSKFNIHNPPTTDKLLVDYHRTPMKIGAFEVILM